MWRENPGFSFFHSELQLHAQLGSPSSSFKYKHVDSRTDSVRAMLINKHF